MLGLQLGGTPAERLVDGPAGLADPLAGVLARLRRQGADLAVGQRQRRAVAGVGEPDLLQLVEVAAAAIAATASSRIAATSSACSGVTSTGS